MDIGTELIKGIYDLHVHSAPDLLPRKVDDIDMAQLCIKTGMAGFASKSHFFCTAERAKIVNKMFPECREIGTICLNNSVGGINPIAVEMAGRAGTRLVWFPTCDAKWERDYAEKEQGKRAFWAQIVDDLAAEGIEMPGISILDEKGELKTCVYEVLDVIKKYSMVLCTGHISHEETFKLVKAAHDKGIDRILITHVTFPSTFYTVDEQRELIAMGAYMEQAYSTYSTGKVDFQTVVDQIKAVGPEHYVLGSDLGQSVRISPELGMQEFVKDLYNAGFTAEEIYTMGHVNSEKLINV